MCQPRLSCHMSIGLEDIENWGNNYKSFLPNFEEGLVAITNSKEITPSLNRWPAVKTRYCFECFDNNADTGASKRQSKSMRGSIRIRDENESKCFCYS